MPSFFYTQWYGCPMRLHRFIGDFQIGSSTLTIHDPRIVHQIRHVLRLKSGEKFILCDGTNREAEGTITDLRKDSIQVSLEKPSVISRDPFFRVTLYSAI